MNTNAPSPFGRLSDPLELAQALIRCPSVTPADAGALGVLEEALTGLGFSCKRLSFGDPDSQGPDALVENLYARIGVDRPNFCFAGHTDVVPPGAIESWDNDPFAGITRNGILHGRGASDMKGSIAAFVAACSRFLVGSRPYGSISLLITGDEEKDARNGTVRVLDWMKRHDEHIDACLVGEPTNPQRLGDMMKIGRRGSVNATLVVEGTQGHVAYPELADNPIPRLIALLSSLLAEAPDDGTDHFQPSNLEVTSVDVGNSVTNVIPDSARACFNVRYSPAHSPASLEKWLRERLDLASAGTYRLELQWSGPAFLTEPGRLTEVVSRAVADVTGRQPEASTSGGTSDARFIQSVCPVVEFGGVGKTMHQVNEHIQIEDLRALADVYEQVLGLFFETEGGVGSDRSGRARNAT